MGAGPVVGIQSPGDMGHGVGAMLRQHGLRVVSYLGGRSDRTHVLAREADIEPVPSYEALVREADVVLSILVPDRALDFAHELARAIRSTGADVLVADCNAISPGTAAAVGEAIVDAGGRFADAGIIGAPPPSPSNHFYASGSGAAELARLGAYGLDIRVLPGPVGRASGLKMCYAALTKGLQALGTELLVAAEVLGLADALRAEQQRSMGPVVGALGRLLPEMPPKAHRWVGEMEEIARTFEEVGLTPRLFEGAADVYRFVASTPLGVETPENRDRSREMDGVVRALAEALQHP